MESQYHLLHMIDVSQTGVYYMTQMFERVCQILTEWPQAYQNEDERDVAVEEKVVGIYYNKV